jgi:hypothetical protein
VFTARYALDPYITQICFVLNMLNKGKSDALTREHEESDVFVRVALNRWWNNSDKGERQTSENTSTDLRSHGR